MNDNKTQVRLLDKQGATHDMVCEDLGWNADWVRVIHDDQNETVYNKDNIDVIEVKYPEPAAEIEHDENGNPIEIVQEG